MPVFQEESHSARNLRYLPSVANPLPRLTSHTGADNEYEVIIIGEYQAGPAGIFLNLCLARYGLSDRSLLCIDAKPGTLKSGQADGLQPRTLEVLKSLGLADEILNQGCHMTEVAFWNPSDEVEVSNSTKKGGIVRTSLAPDVAVPARYQHEVTIHQGRIERILEENFRLYNDRGILRSHHFVDFELDPKGNPEFPVLVRVEDASSDGERVQKAFRTKHLVGADGAHSQVRRNMGLKLEGETTDHIWGVVDFVSETDFPDIRRRCAIHSNAGSVMIIPRERIATGQYLTRLYVQVKDDEVPASTELGLERVVSSAKSREKRAAITLESIFAQAERVFHPYKMAIKEGTVVDWWAAYQIGQRMAPQFSLKDDSGVERVFIVGDACHTHSPKAGQGMNISMMDSYNLSWKLVHSIFGLTPKPESGVTDPVLATFEKERLDIARQLIEFDTKFSSMFSGQIGDVNLEAHNLTHDTFLKVFSDGNGFTSGCGIEYRDNQIVHQEQPDCPVSRTDYINGTLKVGRRLRNVRVKRFADSNPRDLQDDFLSTGRYRILVLASYDLLESQGRSASTIESIGRDIIPSFPAETVELVAVHPIKNTPFEWTDLPPCLKAHAEMSFHGLDSDDVYRIYSVSEHDGAVAVVRPDGYIGAIAPLHKTEEIWRYLKNCLVSVTGSQ